MSISSKQFSNLIGGYGFETYEPEALELFNSEMNSIVGKSMVGGRVSMPGDYFGSPDPNTTSANNGSNEMMASVTDVLARPSLEQTFPKVGGSANDSKIFDVALKKYRMEGGGPSKLKSEKKEQSKIIFKDIIDKIFKEVRKIASKTKLLKVNQLKRALKKI